MLTKERIDELDQMMREVPFGETQFKLAAFADNIAPERKFRHHMLQYNDRKMALDEAKYRRQKHELEIREKELAREKLEVDIAELREKLAKEVKFIEDAIIEIDAHNRELEKLPKFTRAQIEARELNYWQTRAIGQAKRELEFCGRIEIETRKLLDDVGVRLERRQLSEGMCETLFHRTQLFLEIQPEQKP